MKQSVLDCRECGACCRGAADGRVLVDEADLVRWRREKRPDILNSLVPGHFDQLGMPADNAGTCSFLGTTESSLDCSIYQTRGWACRALEKGSAQCHSYRRAAGLE